MKRKQQKKCVQIVFENLETSHRLLLFVCLFVLVVVVVCALCVCVFFVCLFVGFFVGQIVPHGRRI